MSPYPNPMITNQTLRKPYIVKSAVTSLHHHCSHHHHHHLRLYHHQQQHPISKYHAGLTSPTDYRLSIPRLPVLFISLSTTLIDRIQQHFHSPFKLTQNSVWFNLFYIGVYVYRFVCSKYICMYACLYEL